MMVSGIARRGMFATASGSARASSSRALSTSVQRANRAPVPPRSMANETEAASADRNAAQMPGAQGSTRQRVGDSAFKILESMTSSTGTPGDFTPVTSALPVTTPSSPGLEAVHTTPTGPIYTPSTLPFKTDPTLEFMVNLLMKDGKKAQAQRQVRLALEYISQLTHANPLPLVQHAIERCSPLVRMSSTKSGAKNVQVPIALSNRQSMRKGIVWIIEASDKRPDRNISRRLAAELIAVSDGNSSALQRKEEAHKIATVNRANAAVRV